METKEALKLPELIRTIRTFHQPSAVVTFHDDALGPDLVHACIQAPEGQGRGFGSGHSPQFALSKAYSEWVERQMFYSLATERDFHSTNGMAAHPDQHAAVKTATFELVERDAFLVGWLAGRAPRWLSRSEITQADPTGWLSFQVELFNEHHFSLSLGVIGTSLSAAVVVAAIKVLDPLQNSGGVAVQTSAAASVSEGFRHAVESQRAVATVVLNRQRDTALKNLTNNAPLSQPRDLLDHFLNPAHAAEIDWYLNGSCDPVEFLNVAVHVEQFCPQSAIPLTVARASSPEMQDYFACEVPSDRINWKRLSSIFPGISSINNRLHPLS